MIRQTILLLLILNLSVISTFAADIPTLRGHVNDYAEMIPASTEQKLEQLLSSFERSDSTQIAVLTIPSLEGQSLDLYSLDVVEKWKLGQRESDNGALLLIAKNDRKIRIEVGYGLEGRLTDLLAGRIIDNEISPRFKAGDFSGGIAAGVVAMTEAVRGEYKGTGSTRSNRKNKGGFPLDLIIMALFVGPGLIGSLFGSKNRSRRGRHSSLWIGGGGFGGSSGFGGGGGFSGGGGGFGGGGSSGGW